MAKVLYLKNQCQVNCVSSVAIISIVGGKTGGGGWTKVGAVAPWPRPRTTTVKNRKLVTSLGFNVPLAVADTEGESASGGHAPPRSPRPNFAVA